MESLKELVNIITKYKLRYIEIVGESDGTNSKSSRINELYQNVLNKKFQTDDDAARFFFDDNRKNPNYRKLKNSLKRHLINSAFFIDTSSSEFNESQRAYYNCCKDWAAINILFGRSAKHSAVILAERVLKQALKYEFTVLVVDISKTLRGHFGGVGGNTAKYNRYKEIFSKNVKIWNAEMIAEGFYTELVTNYIHSITTKPYIFEVANDYLLELKPHLESFETYRLHMFAYLIEIIKYTSINDYKSMSESCERAITFFETKSYLAKQPLALFLHQKIVCHIQLKEYNAGKITAEKSLELIEEGTYKWFKQLELNLILAFHTRMYQDAYIVFNKAVNHKNFKLQFGRHAEVWKLYEAYLFYIISMNKISFSMKEERNVKKFRIGKFLNEVPTYSKDKRGMNIPVLIAHILFLIQQNKYDDAVDRIETIEKYCSRHLQKDENYRSNCFIKMLVQIPKASFYKIAVLKKAEKYVQKLNELPLEKAEQSFEIEIIPYEHLWGYIIQSLDNQYH